MSAFVLRDYQQAALDAVEVELQKGIKKQLIVLAVGAGKTVVFSQLPKIYKQKMLVIAHREELLLQAKAKIEAVNPSLNVQIEQGPNYADEDADVVIASVATLGRKNTKRLSRFRKDEFPLQVVDEAHHLPAESYLRVFDYFDDYQLRLGVTATPQRTDKRTLIGVFDKISYHLPMKELIKRKYLCDLVTYRVSTTTNISGVKSRGGDYIDSQLSKVINNEDRNKLIIQAYRNYSEGKKTLIFCADVKHAKDLHTSFQSSGINNTNYLIGETPSDQRSEMLEWFSNTSDAILINVGVLTEGFDEPSIQTIILARPTKSQLLLTQIVGRGTRLHETKPHCIVIDIADVTQRIKPTGIPSLMGLPADFDTQNKPLTEVSDAYEELEEKSISQAAQVRSLDDIAIAWEQIDIFKPPTKPQHLEDITPFIWSETHDDHYSLLMMDDEKLTIIPNALGTWEIYYHKGSKKAKVSEVEKMVDAFNLADKWIKRFRSSQMNILDSNARWRSEPPTDPQLRTLKRYSVPITEDLTKGEAAQIISKLYEGD